MSDKAEKKPDAAPPAAEKPPAKAGGMGGLLAKTPIVLGGVMLVEAIVLIAGFKIIGGGAPRTANGADLVQPSKVEGKDGAKSDPETTGKPKLVEIDLIDFKAPNKLSGHSFLYDMRIAVTAKPEFESRVHDAVKANDGLIQDRIRTIIAELDPEKLGGASEPGLETLKRQVKFQLDQIMGDGLIDEVLVPRCIPIRTDY